MSYCEHGGTCELDEGHVGLHDSSYCQWTNEKAIDKETADALFRGNVGPAADTIISVTDALVKELRALENHQ
jgi:hypothetical protein